MEVLQLRGGEQDAQTRWALALLDIQRPDMDGLDLAHRLRERVPDTNRLLLVAVTGYGHDEARERSFAAGFDQHLAKPAGSRLSVPVSLRSWSPSVRSSSSGDPSTPDRRNGQGSSPSPCCPPVGVAGPQDVEAVPRWTRPLPGGALCAAQGPSAALARRPGEATRRQGGIVLAGNLRWVIALIASLDLPPRIG
ncbi:MAG: response regulator [Chromatiaceae bacterium]|nr:response regulator [Chromatiaceae bacterium]